MKTSEDDGLGYYNGRYYLILADGGAMYEAKIKSIEVNEDHTYTVLLKENEYLPVEESVKAVRQI